MITFYFVGVAIVALFFIVFGSYILARGDDDYHILHLLGSVVVYSWFSWLFVLVAISIFLWKLRKIYKLAKEIS